MSISRSVGARQLALLVAAALISAAAPHGRHAPQQWALIVGIGDYQSFGDEIGGDLPGSVNDANAFRDVAVARFGVPPGNVHLVLDEAATRARIEHELTAWLPSVAGPDDVVWVFFAGHGSQVWDEDGDEEDGLEETICPTDVMRGSPEMDIVDDQIQLWLNGIPAAEVVVVWDKCHAESSTRAVTPFARPRALDRRPEEDLERPAGIGLREARTQRGLGDRIVSRPFEEWRGQRVPNIVEIAASRADEVAVDAVWPAQGGAPARFGGAFTTNFVRNAWQARSDATLEDVFIRTGHDLRAQRFQQRPTLTGESAIRTRSLAAIASGDLADRRAGSGSGTLPVVSVDGDRVTLGGGANAGVTLGSIYRVGDAFLRVSDVTADAIRALRVDAEPREVDAVAGDTLAPGARARLVTYAYPPVELRVSVADLPAAARSAMQSALAGIESLQLVSEAREFAHLIVRPAQNGFVVLGLDGFARHHVPAADPTGAGRLLRPILQREVQAHQLAELDNPARPFGLDFGFNHADSRFGLGDLVEFHVVSERPGYLTIVDLGTDGSVTVLFPNELDTNNRIEAAQAFVLPTPAMGMEFRATPPAGRGIVRAFLTERPLVLELGGDDPHLGRAVMAALAGAVGPAPLRDSNALPVGRWATASVPYEVTP